MQCKAPDVSKHLKYVLTFLLIDIFQLKFTTSDNLPNAAMAIHSVLFFHHEESIYAAIKTQNKIFTVIGFNISSH